MQYIKFAIATQAQNATAYTYTTRIMTNTRKEYDEVYVYSLAHLGTNISIGALIRHRTICVSSAEKSLRAKSHWVRLSRDGAVHASQTGFAVQTRVEASVVTESTQWAWVLIVVLGTYSEKEHYV